MPSSTSPSGSTPPGGPRAALAALFMVDVVSIFVLFHVPDPRVAAGVAVLLNLAAAHAVGRLFGRRSGASGDAWSTLLSTARALLSLAPPGFGSGPVDSGM